VRRRWPFLAILVALAPGLARADAVRTWGGVPDPPNPTVAAPGTPAAPLAPPAPPPVTLGTPTPGSSSGAASPPSADASPAEDEEEASRHKSGGVTGLKYTLEGVQVRGNRTTLTSVVLRYVTLRAGDVLDVNGPELELTRFRLLGTGFFRDVQLSLQKGSRRGNVVLVVDVAERNTLVIDQIWLGLGANVDPDGKAAPLSAYAGAQATETNLAGTGIALGGAFALAENQFAMRLRLLDPQTFRANWITEAEFVYNDAQGFLGNRDVLVDDPNASATAGQAAIDYAVARYRRLGGRVSIGHDLGISSRIFIDYRLEKVDALLPSAASDNCGSEICPIDFMLVPGSSVLSTLGAAFTYDTRDDPFLTTRGQELVASVAASLTPFGSDYPYTKVVVHGSQWFPLSWGHVLHLEAFAGVVSGNAPLFERFYVGDLSDLLPDRALDLTFDRRAAPNFLSTDIVENNYGNYAAEIDLEYRVPLYRGTRSIYGVDLFGSFGIYGLANASNFTQYPLGYSGFATVPVDLTFNAGLRIDTQAGGFVLGLANLVGLIPVRGQDRP
jgi:outer membrane protein insertion porin family